MILQITEILKNHPSNNGNNYTVVKFKRPGTGDFYMTYLCPDYRNWKNWEKHLRVGKFIKNLYPKPGDPKIINADCFPKALTKKDKAMMEYTVRTAHMAPDELRQYHQHIGIYV